MRILERDDCTLDLTVGDRIEYALDAGGQHIVIGTALDGIDRLTGFLEQTDVRAADADRLFEATQRAAERDGLARFYPASIRSEVCRWFHQAGLSHDWTTDGRRRLREHIVAMVPQPGTRRTVTISLSFWTPGDGETFSVTEEYRAPDEILGYSYGLALPHDVVPQLTEYLAGRHVPGDPEDQLIAGRR